MTNPIPPCPVCGEQPTEKRCRDNPSDIVGVYHHKCTGSQMYTLDHWQEHCSNYLGRALRAAGITTIAQLTERLDLLTQYRANNDAQIRRIAELESVAPDPRVAVLDKAGINTAVELADALGDEDWRSWLDRIAAQRGEGQVCQSK